MVMVLWVIPLRPVPDTLYPRRDNSYPTTYNTVLRACKCSIFLTVTTTKTLLYILMLDKTSKYSIAEGLSWLPILYCIVLYCIVLYCIVWKESKVKIVRKALRVFLWSNEAKNKYPTYMIEQMTYEDPMLKSELYQQTNDWYKADEYCTCNIGMKYSLCC